MSRWDTMTYQIDVKGTKKVANPQDTISEDIVTVNCTVAYLSSEMGDSKCEKSCETMGASSYRWFNDGCCECVGHSCVNYGINQSQCSFALSNGEESALDDQLDYENLSEEELRALEAEYGLLEEDEES